MKNTERYIAFIIERSHITAVEVAHSPKGKTLTAAGSFDSIINFDNPEVYGEVGSAGREKTFVKEIQNFMKRIGAGAHYFSFGLNSKMAMLQTIPIDMSLTDEELKLLLKRAQEMALGHLEFDDLARDTIIGYADGDARRFLNLLEQTSTAAKATDLRLITADFLQNALTLNSRRFDKGGDNFYDQISALHKSVRGSHPDAALYWLTRMLDGGADARYLSRRIVRMAWEDIGLADPRAMQIANDAALTYERLGSPEGELALGQAVIYLSVAAKSNAGYNAYNQAKAFVKQDKSREVPVHLRNAPTKLMKELGYGHEYRYAHDEPNAYAAGETYLPDGMQEPAWYQPTPRGLEAKIGEKLALLRKWDDEAGTPDK